MPLETIERREREDRKDCSLDPHLPQLGDQPSSAQKDWTAYVNVYGDKINEYEGSKHNVSGRCRLSLRLLIDRQPYLAQDPDHCSEEALHPALMVKNDSTIALLMFGMLSAPWSDGRYIQGLGSSWRGNWIAINCLQIRVRA